MPQSFRPGFLAPSLVPACAGAWWRWYWGSTEEASALAWSPIARPKSRASSACGWRGFFF